MDTLTIINNKLHQRISDLQDVVRDLQRRNDRLVTMNIELKSAVSYRDDAIAAWRTSTAILEKRIKNLESTKEWANGIDATFKDQG